jgi:hypothetical protein
LSASEEACGRTDWGSNANTTIPRSNVAPEQKRNKKMEIRKLEILKERIDSFCARANLEEMFFALGFRHGDAYASGAPYRELEFLEVFEEGPGMYFGEAETEYLIQECDILKATISGEGSRLLVYENMKKGKSLKRKYVSGFVVGALLVMNGPGSGDPELFEHAG